jgi:hypothetical protein
VIVGLASGSVYTAVDVDDAATWPAEVREHVDGVCERVAGTTEYASDLELSWEEEAEFRTLLGARPLLTYHFTRLLDVEVERIRDVEGLRPLTRDLVERRIDDALSGGHVAAAQAERLRATHVFRKDGASGRQDQVCLVLGDDALRTGRGVVTLLSMWGGEAQYAPTYELRELLEQMGRPSVVLAALDLTAPGKHDVWPGVLKTFVGTQLDLQGAGAAVHYRAPVSAAAILDIWQPGHPAYDATRLPQ